jgi:UPF0271 protein
MTVVLNIDLGELAAEEEELYRLAHWANIACGGHAGDEVSMQRALERCRRLGAHPGAHPSYPDREHFGRRAMNLVGEALRHQVRIQCGELARLASAQGLTLDHVKAHGALYHAIHAEPECAGAYLDGIGDALGPAPIVVGMSGGALEQEARRRGLPFARELFADRAADTAGNLIPREQPGAVIDRPDDAAQRATVLLESRSCETLCVHGDTPNAVAIAGALRRLLDAPC